MKKIVFLDRDGVINTDSPEYIKSWDEFRFLPGSIDAIKRLTENEFNVIVVTNQSAVGRGMISLDALLETHQRMGRKILEAGGAIMDIFYCPHHPDEGCECRKPKPGLILQAAQKYSIDLAAAWMIGDSARDVECGVNAGCGGTILVKTGNGKEAQKILHEKGVFPDYIALNLLCAVEHVCSCKQESRANKEKGVKRHLV